MATLELSKAEQQALELLKNSPSEIQSIASPNGTIAIDAIHTYFINLTRQLEYTRVRRKNEYIDVDKKEI